MKVEPAVIAAGGLSHDALVFESEALIEVASTEIVFKDVKEKAVRAKFAEGNAYDLAENATTRPLARHGDNNPLQLYRA